jgi:hypothetical protein
MNWKGCGRKWSWPNLMFYPSIFVEGLRKNTENLNFDIKSVCQDFNLELPEYEMSDNHSTGMYDGCFS